MPPKNKPTEEASASSLSAQLEQISDQLRTFKDRFDTQDEKFAELKTLLEATARENTKLKEENTTQKAEIIMLKDKVNSLEQRNRADSVRVFNIPLTGDETDNLNVAEQVYRNAFCPFSGERPPKGNCKPSHPALKPSKSPTFCRVIASQSRS